MQLENRIEREIEEKEGLLQDIEKTVDLKILPMKHYKETLVSAREFSIGYKDAEAPLFDSLTFEIKHGERVFLNGNNGCGKSSLIKAILAAADDKNYKTASGRQFREATEKVKNMQFGGSFEVVPNLVISYINQDTSLLKGGIKEFCSERKLDESLFCAILRQLDMERVQFAKNMEEYSEGQKKKVLIAASLMTPAHLYIWDEPLNYIDVFSRMQIEKLLEEYAPTMLIVEHDVRFREKISTKVIELG